MKKTVKCVKFVRFLENSYGLKGGNYLNERYVFSVYC